MKGKGTNRIKRSFELNAPSRKVVVHKSQVDSLTDET